MIRKSLCLTMLLLAAVPANADVTPEQAWENWQAFATNDGQELTVGTTARNGDRLEVSDIVITKTDPSSGFSSMVTFDQVAFQDNGDGTVTVVVPETYPLRLAVPAEAPGAEPTLLNLSVVQPDTKIIVSGDPTEPLRYDVTAPFIGLTLEQAPVINDLTYDRVELIFRDMTGNYLVSTTGDAAAVDGNFAIGSIDFALDVKRSDDGVNMALSIADVAMRLKANVLNTAAIADMAAAVNDGLVMDLGFSFDTLALTVTSDEEGGDLITKVQLAGGEFSLGLDQTTLRYRTVLDWAKFVSGDKVRQSPLAEMALDALEIDLVMPVSKSTNPQPFSLAARLEDLTGNWNLFALPDPGVLLNRDPLNLTVDVKGTGNWNHDILAPGFDFEAVEDPGQLHQLDLTALRAAAGGASAEATGQLTFDPTTAAPEGSITLAIQGAEVLMTKLVAMGLMGDDDVRQARVMLAIFARPGDSADSLTSELEFKDGALFANGQPL